MSKRHTTIATAGVCLLLAVPPVGAQEPDAIPVPVVDLSAGYTFISGLRDASGAGGQGYNLPAGWYVSGGVNLSRWAGVVAEVTGSYRSGLAATYVGSSFERDVSQYTGLAGPRFLYKRGRVASYAQMLFGVARVRQNSRWVFSDGGTSAVTTDTFGALQPGGGINFLLTESVGVRVGADYRLIINSSDDGLNDYASQLRLISGLTLQWGRR